jgi:hypothetical protein
VGVRAISDNGSLDIISSAARLSGSQDGFQELRGKFYPLIYRVPQRVVNRGTVEKPDRDSLVLGNLNSRHEVGVPSDDGRVSDLPLGAEAHQVNAKEDVYLLLDENKLPLLVSIAEEVPLAEFKARETSSGVLEALVVGESVAFVRGRGRADVRRTEVIVGAQNV